MKLLRMIIHRTITIADFIMEDGQMRCLGTKSKSKTFQKKDPAPKPLQAYWLESAPIPYQKLEDEMKRVGILDTADGSWQLVHKGGSSQRHLRAFYNLLYKAKCLPFMNGAELMKTFNASFKTNLAHYRGFNGKDDCWNQEKEIRNMLSVFGNIFSERKCNVGHEE